MNHPKTLTTLPFDIIDIIQMRFYKEQSFQSFALDKFIHQASAQAFPPFWEAFLNPTYPKHRRG